MKPGDLVRIKDIRANKESHRGLVCLVLEVEKPVMDKSSGSVCVIQSVRKRLRYHEGRLELISEPD